MPNRTARILVVDDNAWLCDLLRLHLTAEGYEVAQACDAIEAGYAILRSPPDLLVIDLNMPYMSGRELAAALVADTSIPAIPFIFLSGDEMRVDQVTHLGAAACLLKPVAKEHLLAAVAKALTRSPELAAA